MRYKTMSIKDILSYVTTRYTYDRKTGRFYHAIRRHGTPRKVGAEAGSVSKSNNCYLIYVAGANVARYRLVWLLEHGAWPPGYIQHLDGNKFNDCISNLALARDFLPEGKIKQDRRPKKDEPAQMPPNVTFLERRGQYRVDIPGRPAQYFDSLSQAQGAL